MTSGYGRIKDWKEYFRRYFPQWKKFMNSSGIHQKTVALFLCLELSSATQFATPKIRDEWRIDVFVPKGY